MNWKSWPYWVKGGIGGGIVFVLLFISSDFHRILGNILSVSWHDKIASLILPLFCPKTDILLTEGSWLGKCWNIYGFIILGLLIIEFIIVGTVIGYLYGKLSAKGGSAPGGKNRQKVI